MQPAVSHLSPYGGSWYPGDPIQLRELLDQLFESSQRRTGRYLAPKPRAFVVPHAGLAYSGAVAAAAYRHLQAGQPETILLLGFPHHGSAPGIWIPDVDAIRTPLGEVAVDRQAVQALLETPHFKRLQESVLCDHSVEIQLPFLQTAVPRARIVPLYVSHLDGPMRDSAAGVLATWLPPGAVLMASSDFTHYGKAFGFQPFPPDERVSDRLRDLDESVIQAAGSLRQELFLEALRTTSATVCGVQPIALLLATLRLLDGEEEIFQELLDYQTSGDLTGDYKHCVSYAALGYFPHTAFHLDQEDQQLLLESARRTLAHYLSTGLREPILPARQTAALERRAAAFVTLHKHGRLRGCVGRRSAAESLFQSIPDLTLSAALEDTRFDPVSPSEQGLEVEISVLSPMKRIPDLDCFRVGPHGALLDSGRRHSLLLPQVATEAKWKAKQFFDALARKAGLTSEVYRDPATRLHVFRAQVIQ